jgi:hypothetical protein
MDITKFKEEELEKSIIVDLKKKYNIENIIMKRYDNDLEINNFYQIYYNEIEKLEKIGFDIWKLFTKLWKNENQEIILNILNLIIFLEKESLKIKRIVLNIMNKNKHHNLIEDKQHLLDLVNKRRNEYEMNYKFVDINSSYEDLVKLYLESKEKCNLELEKEFQRLQNLEKLN